MNLERYRLYHEHHRRESEDLPFWVRVARRWGHAGTLELGCGTGRVYHALRDAGIRAFGVDLDPGMLAILREQDHLKGRSSVFLGDMRSLGVAAGSFGLVILPCNTFSTFSAEAQAEIVTGVARVLPPKGVFVVSMPNPLLLTNLPSHGDLELDTTFSHPLSGEMVQAFSAWQRTGVRIAMGVPLCRSASCLAGAASLAAARGLCPVVGSAWSGSYLPVWRFRARRV